MNKRPKSSALGSPFLLNMVSFSATQAASVLSTPSSSLLFFFLGGGGKGGRQGGSVGWWPSPSWRSPARKTPTHTKQQTLSQTEINRAKEGGGNEKYNDLYLKEGWHNPAEIWFDEVKVSNPTDLALIRFIFRNFKTFKYNFNLINMGM